MIQDTQQGRFWIPDKPEEPVPGTLAVKSQGKLELTTSHVENNFRDNFRPYFERDHESTTISGVTTDGIIALIEARLLDRKTRGPMEQTAQTQKPSQASTAVPDGRYTPKAATHTTGPSQPEPTESWQRNEKAAQETQRQENIELRRDQLEGALPRNGRTWPCWALQTSAQLRRYDGDEDLGPWPCFTGLCDEGADHGVEPPHMFHCRQHAEERQGRKPLAKPESHRDKGVCITCGEPAEPTPGLSGTHLELCPQAEVAHSTVARICTQRYCSARKASVARGRQQGMPPSV